LALSNASFAEGGDDSTTYLKNTGRERAQREEKKRKEKIEKSNAPQHSAIVAMSSEDAKKDLLIPVRKGKVGLHISQKIIKKTSRRRFRNTREKG